MRFAILCLLFASLAFAHTILKSSAPVCVLEQSDCSHLGHDYQLLNETLPTQKLKFFFAVRQRNLDVLSATLELVSNPKSTSYGKYLTHDQVKAIVSDQGAIDQVSAYLIQESQSMEESARIDVKGDYIQVVATARFAEQIFSTRFYAFQSIQQKTIIHRALNYSLASEIAHLVDYVSSVTHFPPIRPVRIRSFLTEGVATTTPSLITKYYGIDSNVVTNSASTQSVFESLGQSFDDADLQAFFAKFNVPRQTVSNFIGPNDQNACKNDPNNCGESLLDVEYLMAVAQNAPTTYWSVDGSEDFTQWLVDVTNNANPPLVHSVSYGEVESNIADGDRFNTAAQQLGVRGVTIVIASGDDGVANFPARQDPSKCGFNPSFPASSPFVTSVGATQGPEASKAEVACSSTTGCIITTGGGFSQQFAQPSYQSAAVSQYLNSGVSLPPSSMFNSAGRAYPDVAMLGNAYVVVDGGRTLVESGTSASAPVFAALLTLINSARLDAGKPALGFVNPALYSVFASTPSAFRDVTVGHNNCCAGNSNQVCCPYGFYATNGFDPLSGLGSANYAVLKKALLSL